MFVVTNRLSVNPEHREEFERRFRERARLADNEPGFLRNEVWRPAEGNDYVVTTYWQDEASFEAWTQSEAFRKSHAGGGSPGMFLGRPTLEKYVVIQSSDDR